jgi:hypothetical protein
MSLPTDWLHHATMLRDSVRIDAFERAMRETIAKNHSVVDIGAGTGILSAMAAQHTRGSVTAVEYFQPSANCARELFDVAKLDRVKVIAESSYNLKLENSPQIVVSETIGPVGPEENIVELCYIFKRRHPSVENFIPMRLDLWAQPVKSAVVENSKREVLDSFLNLRVGSFNYQSLAAELEAAFCSRLQCLIDSECEPLAEVSELVSYHLGVDRDSSFEQFLALDDSSEANAVHIFFEAQLSPSVKLSSQSSAPLTHWKHCFVPRPRQGSHYKNNLHIKYSAKEREWSFVWE